MADDQRQALKQKKQRESGARAEKKKKDAAIASGQDTAEIVELIKRPREYQVVMEFTSVSTLTPPIVEVTRVSSIPFHHCIDSTLQWQISHHTNGTAARRDAHAADRRGSSSIHPPIAFAHSSHDIA